MAVERQRVMGVDTSLRSTGVGIVEAEGGRVRAIAHGTIPFPASARHSACLAGLYRAIQEWLAQTTPDAAALEGVFFSRNLRTTLILGEARGVVMAACAEAGIPVFEYAPRLVKQAVGGVGGADKRQVRRMVMAMLGLREEPREDAGDALAIALCHLHRCRGHAALLPQPI